MPKMKDSEIVRQLAAAAYDDSALEAGEINLTLADVMELYARLVIEEREAVRGLPAVPAGGEAGSAKAEDTACDPGETVSTEADDDDEQQPSFTGQGAREKVRIYARLKNYRVANGLGCFRDVAAVAGHGLTDDAVRSMFFGDRKATLTEWLWIDQALEALQ